MIHSQANKFAAMVVPASVNNTTATEIELDTLGFDYCTIYVYFGDMAAAMTALEIKEGDTSGSYGSAIASYGTTADISGSTSALPTNGDDNKCFMFDVDLKSRKRYIELTATNGSGANLIAAFAILSRADEGPVTAADRGAGNVIRI